MIDLLEGCRQAGGNGEGSPGCTMSGENWGAIQTLGRFHEQLERTDKQGRGNAHEEVAWRKQWHDMGTVIEAEHQLVQSMLNPQHSLCWGFKEIRYGRAPLERETLGKDVTFLSSLCGNPKVILHSRRNVTDEFPSQVLKGRPEQQHISVRQHRCFDMFTNLSSSSAVPGCQQSTKMTTTVFRHYLDDYLEGNENFEKLWKEYLGCTSPLPLPQGNRLRPEKGNG